MILLNFKIMNKCIGQFFFLMSIIANNIGNAGEILFDIEIINQGYISIGFLMQKSNKKIIKITL